MPLELLTSCCSNILQCLPAIFSMVYNLVFKQCHCCHQCPKSYNSLLGSHQTEVRMLNTNSTLSFISQGRTQDFRGFFPIGCTALGGERAKVCKTSQNFPIFSVIFFLSTCSTGFLSYPTDFWNIHNNIWANTLL